MSVLALLSILSLGVAAWFFLPKLLLHATIAFAAFLITASLALAFNGADQLQYILFGGGVAAFSACVLRFVSLAVRG